MYWKCQRLIISAFKRTALKVWATNHFQTDQNDICSFADDKCGKFDQTVPLTRTLNRSEFVQGKTTKSFQRLNGLSSLTFYQVHRNVFASENHCTTKKILVFKQKTANTFRATSLATTLCLRSSIHTIQGDSRFATTLMLLVFRSMKFSQQQFDRFMVFVEKCIVDSAKLDFRTSWPMDLREKKAMHLLQIYIVSLPLLWALRCLKKLCIMH